MGESSDPELLGAVWGTGRVGLRRVRSYHCASGSDSAPNPTYTQSEGRAGGNVGIGYVKTPA